MLVEEVYCHLPVVYVLFALLYSLVEGLDPSPVSEILPVGVEVERLFEILHIKSVIFDVANKVEPGFLSIVISLLLGKEIVGPLDENADISLTESEEEVVVLEVRQCLGDSVA